MASVPTGGPPRPSSAAGTPSAAAMPPASPAAAAPATAGPLTAIDLSSEESKDNASDLLRGFPYLSRSCHYPRFDSNSLENECRRKIRPKDVSCLGLLHEVFTGGSVRAEPRKQRKMLSGTRRRHGVSYTLTTARRLSL